MLSQDLVVGADRLPRPSWAAGDPLMRDYYDHEWGVPVIDDRGVFERLSLECFQSGLSWAIILRKREAFRSAFAGFDPVEVAGFGEDDVARLMADSAIVRNRAKITATITNARRVLAIDGGLARFVWSFRPARTPVPHHVAQVPTTSPESTALARALKARGLRFIGPTTAFAMMEAIGVVDTHLVGSHRRGCSGLWDESGLACRDPFDVA